MAMTLDEIRGGLAGGPDMRLAAIHAARELAGEAFRTVVPDLLQLLGQEQPGRVSKREAVLVDDEIVGAAVRALVAHGRARDAMDALLDAGRSPSTRVRAAALRGLADVGAGRPAALALLGATGDPDGHVAGVAARVLAGLRLRAPGCLCAADAPALADALEARPHTVTAVAEILGLMGHDAQTVLPRVLAYARTRAEAHLRGPALVAAAQIAPTDAEVLALARELAQGADASAAGFGRSALRLMVPQEHAPRGVRGR